MLTELKQAPEAHPSGQPRNGAGRLVKVVFPSLCEKHRVHLVDIDPRWGVFDCGMGSTD